MSEELITAMKVMKELMKAHWTIQSNLYLAKSRLWQGYPSQYSYHAKIEELMSLSTQTFGKVWYEIDEYRELSPDAFELFRDDLKRAVDLSTSLASGYDENKILELRAKLIEIGQKIDTHLKHKSQLGVFILEDESPPAVPHPSSSKPCERSRKNMIG